MKASGLKMVRSDLAEVFLEEGMIGWDSLADVMSNKPNDMKQIKIDKHQSTHCKSRSGHVHFSNSSPCF